MCSTWTAGGSCVTGYHCNRQPSINTNNTSHTALLAAWRACAARIAFRKATSILLVFDSTWCPRTTTVWPLLSYPDQRPSLCASYPMPVVSLSPSNAQDLESQTCNVMAAAKAEAVGMPRTPTLHAGQT